MTFCLGLKDNEFYDIRIVYKLIHYWVRIASRIWRAKVRVKLVKYLECMILVRVHFLCNFEKVKINLSVYRFCKRTSLHVVHRFY